MSVFENRKPVVHKNQFTLEDASDTFKMATEKLDDKSLPNQTVTLLIALAELASKVLAAV